MATSPDGHVLRQAHLTCGRVKPALCDPHPLRDKGIIKQN